MIQPAGIQEDGSGGTVKLFANEGAASRIAAGKPFGRQAADAAGKLASPAGKNSLF